MASFNADAMVKPLMALLLARVMALPSVSILVLVMVGEELVSAGIKMVPAEVCIEWLTPEPQNF